MRATASRATPYRSRRKSRPRLALWFIGILVLGGSVFWFRSRYSLALQTPVLIEWRSPLVLTKRAATATETLQGGPGLSQWQQYTCQKFGDDCLTALAVQRAENLSGKCDAYHYNSNGTLDWGYFQINTVHLERPGLSLRDLLDCKTNINFAYQLYREKAGFSPWSTFRSGRYRDFMAR